MSFLKLYKRPSENQIIKTENRIPSTGNPVCFIFNLERQPYTGADGAARQWCDIFEHRVLRSCSTVGKVACIFILCLLFIKLTCSFKNSYTMCYQRFSHVMLGVMEAIAIDLASNDTLVSIRASYRQRPLQNSFSPTAET